MATTTTTHADSYLCLTRWDNDNGKTEQLEWRIQQQKKEEVTERIKCTHEAPEHEHIQFSMKRKNAHSQRQEKCQGVKVLLAKESEILSLHELEKKWIFRKKEKRSSVWRF